MITFDTIRQEQLTEEYLEEKQIIVGKGKNYNNIIFLAGGAGSGKGFAIKNFLQGEKYRVRDVDEWKRLVMKIHKLKRSDSSLKNLNLRNPDDVFVLHQYVEKLGIKDKTLSGMLKGMSGDNRPNILFDITLKNLNNIAMSLPGLLEVGYQPKNIHLIWVLTDYAVAVKQNKSRDRVVPDDILLKTHEGAANTMMQIISKGLPNGMDGALHVVLGGKDHTVVYAGSDGKPLKDKTGEVIVKDFTYFTLKKEGRPMLKDVNKGPGGTLSGDVIKQKLFDIIKKKIPKGKTLSQIMK